MDYKKKIELLKKKDYLTTAEVGAILFASCTSIRNYCKGKDLEYTQVPGGRRKIRHETVRRYMVAKNVRNKEYLSDAEFEALKNAMAASPLLSHDEALLEVQIVLEDKGGTPKTKLDRIKDLVSAHR